MTITQSPTITYYGEVPPAGTAVSVEYAGYPIIYHDASNLTFHDGSHVIFHNIVSVSPDVSYSFSVPHITYAGEAE